MGDVQEKSLLCGIYAVRIFIAIFIVLTFSFTVSYASETKKAVIDTPTFCHKIEKVEGKNIYLKSGGKTCGSSMPGKAVADVSDTVNTVFVFVDGAFWKEQKLADFNLDDIRGLLEKSKSLEAEVPIPENKYKEEGEKVAREITDFVNSEEFQKKVSDEKERLAKEVFPDQLGQYYKDVKVKADKQGTAGLKNSERIYIFISSSIPVQTLRNYAADIEKLDDPNIVMVLRGFKDGMKKMKPTIEFSLSVLKKDPGCDIVKSGGECALFNMGITLDPLLFRRYGIEQVPAVVYVPHLSVIDAAMSEGKEENAKAGEYYKLYGDASLEYILETIQKETNSASLDGLLKTLKRGFYD